MISQVAETNSLKEQGHHGVDDRADIPQDNHGAVRTLSESTVCRHAPSRRKATDPGVLRMIEPEPYPSTRLRAPTIRSRIMLQVASHLVGQSDWAEKQVMVQLRGQGDEEFTYRLLGGDSPKSVADVAAGRIDVAIVNPAAAASAGLRHAGLRPDALASIATIPSYDQLGLAVTTATGITRIEELPVVRPKLRLTLRGQRDHSVQGFVVDALAAVGVSLVDVEEWGGSVSYDRDMPHLATRMALITAGKVDAVFDEGVYNWGELVMKHGMCFLGFGDETIARLEAQGYRRGELTPHRFPSLTEPVSTLDFSGFMIYTRRDAPDQLVESVCDALLANRDSIAWQGGNSLPLERMVIDTVDAPLAVPLHPAAERFWISHGLRSATAA
jgi:hypothetical protein